MGIRKYFFIFLFFLFIYLPLANSIVKFLPDKPLKGVVVEKQFPQFSLDEFLNGEWQSQYNYYLNENFNCRNLFIRLGNQFVYSFFNKTTNSNLVIGKQKEIFEKIYVHYTLQYTKVVEDEYILELTKKLQDLETKLALKGINLSIFITPAKTEIYGENIPDVYKFCAPKYEDNDTYKKFISALEDSNLRYYDSVIDVKKMKTENLFPVYAKTGTHWTQVTGALIAQQLTKQLENDFGYDLKEFNINIYDVDDPIAPDADLFNLMNIYSRPYDSYLYYKTSVKKEGTDKPNIYVRGGSFAGQSFISIIKGDVFGNNVHMENGYMFTDKYSTYTKFSSYDEIDIEGYLNDTDILILEVNQAAIHNMSFGFIDYLLDSSILD